MPIYLIDKIKQQNNQDFPLMDSNDIHGGHYQVTTLIDRDNIPECRMKPMMMCSVEETGKTYRLHSVAGHVWVEINFGSTGTDWTQFDVYPTTPEITALSVGGYFIVRSSGLIGYKNANETIAEIGYLHQDDIISDIGSSWFTGTSVPDSADGDIDDFYVNRSSWDVYSKTSSGWMMIGNLTGIAGPEGTSITDGIEVPANTIGDNDDYFLHTGDGSIYKKIAGSWTLIDSFLSELVIASTTTLGGVIVGDGLSITGEGVLSVDVSTQEYIHPDHHFPSIISQDPSNRFVTDTEKQIWNAKLDEHGNLGGGLLHTIASNIDAGFMGAVDKTQLIELWNEYTSGSFTTNVAPSADIIVQDEGTSITQSINSINFIGTDVQAIAAGTHVDVYIGTNPVIYSPFFDDIELTSTNTYVNRYIGQPTSEGNPFFVGDYDNPLLTYPTTVEGVLVFKTADTISLLDQTTTFEYKLITPDNTIIESGVSQSITGNGTISIGTHGSIVITDFAIENSRYCANLEFNITNSNPGIVKLVLIHHNATAGDYIHIQSNIFHDPNSTESTIGMLGATVSNIITAKYISGVRYLSLGDTITLAISDIDNLNDITYPDEFLMMDGSDFGMADNIALTKNDMLGWSTNYNVSNVYYDAPIQISQSDYRTISQNAYLYARTIDWVENDLQQSDPVGILIDTFPSISTDLVETFDDENRRLTSSLQYRDPAILLQQNELMTINGELRRQYGDWTQFIPTNTAVYTSSVITQDYYRSFRKDGTSYSHGIFEIIGLTDSELASNLVNIDISLNGIDWFSLNQEYMGGTLFNGDGCRVELDTYTSPQFKFTLGTGGYTSSTTGSQINNYWGIILKLSMVNNVSVQPIQSIKIIDWN